MRHLAILILLFACSARADFKADVLVTLPGQWKKQEAGAASFVFTNTRSKNGEAIGVEMIPLATPTSMKPVDFVALKGVLSKQREKYLRSLAINRYTIHSIDSEESKTRGYLGQITIEASYRGLAGQDVQVVERQYFARDRILQVVYTEETSGLGDRTRINVLLDNFKPRARKTALWNWLFERAIAAETVGGGSGGGTVPSSSTTAQPGSTASTKEVDQTPKDPVAPSKQQRHDLCEGVPEEQKRSESDPPMSIATAAKSCGKAVWEFAKAGASALWNYEFPAADLKQLGKDAYKYAIDSAFRAEQNAGVMAKVESFKRPDLSVMNLLKGIWAAASKVDPPLVCYKESIQIPAFCEGIANYAATGGKGKLLQIAKTSNAGAEAAKLAAATKAAREKFAGAMKAGDKKLAAVAPNAAEKAAEKVADKASDKAASTAGAIRSNAGAADKSAVFEQTKNLSDNERVQVANELFKAQRPEGKITAAQADAVVKAHAVGGAKEHGTYTAAEINQKYRILREAGYSKDETKTLLKNGVAGGRPNDWEKIDFADPDAVRAHVAQAVNSKRPAMDANEALRNGHTREADALHVEAARRLESSRNPAYRDMLARGGATGEYGASFRGNEPAIRKEMVRVKEELKKLQAEADDRTITNKGSPAYYDHLKSNYRKAYEQLQDELEALK